MKSFIALLAIAAVTLCMFALPAESDAGGFALSLGFNRNANVAVVNNHGFRQQRVVVLNNGFNHFNRANVAVVSPFRFNAFGTAAVVDRRGNVFQVDPFGSSVLLRSGFNSFGVQSFNSFGGCNSVLGGCR